MNILEILKSNFENLENLTQNFHIMLRSREQVQISNICIICFVEKLLVLKVNKIFMMCCEVFFLNAFLLIFDRLFHSSQLS